MAILVPDTVYGAGHHGGFAGAGYAGAGHHGGYAGAGHHGQTVHGGVQQVYGGVQEVVQSPELIQAREESQAMWAEVNAKRDNSAAGHHGSASHFGGYGGAHAGFGGHGYGHPAMGHGGHGYGHPAMGHPGFGGFGAAPAAAAPGAEAEK